MVNTEDFIKRLEVILDYYSLNASAFADKIGVQRSSLSHLLSGRNKPSLDFILKILEVFPEVDLYWILNGKGTFPKGTDENAFALETEKKIQPPTPIQNEIPVNLFSSVEIPSANNPVEIKKTFADENIAFSSIQSDIDKIVIFYKNGTFKDYKPS
ncbi:helix-turn-helix transcriptional regulator [Flavobacterium sp. GT3R68]|uniref:helix-turn-helix transcriptional regulator n=1 Tax=Flavobacterium sp. GT3R68 TaxID=2594437 RepID=UPI000F86D075|nr:helix-turn-helix transcriptional regulator [Flavobacterium sp. GT3R68]RTY86330.1 XRE family transcriptional regulator [Flavobacterium sp. GSN2]TRW91558.1 helix-turn-helix transcriptional regulator [Flavobacterium sp. GT3R68]